MLGNYLVLWNARRCRADSLEIFVNLTTAESTIRMRCIEAILEAAEALKYLPDCRRSIEKAIEHLEAARREAEVIDPEEA